ncbi:MAG: LptF/LptG family permease [Mariprofundaceae bacterium]
MTLDRYMLRLWLGPFLAALAIATSVLLLGRALKVLGLVMDRGIEWSIMGSMLMAILPYFLVLTLPIAFFFAMQSLIVRLFQNNELDVLRAAGISYSRMFRVLFGTAILFCLLLGYTAMEWMPNGQKQFQVLLYAIQEAKAAPGFEPQRFNRELDNFTVYIRGEDDQGQMHGFMLEDSRHRKPVVYLAEIADVERAGRQIWFTLYNGSRIEGSGSTLRALSFDQYKLVMDVGSLGLIKKAAWRSRIFEMSMAELYAARKKKDSPEAAAEWNRRLIMPTTVLLLFLFALPLSLEPKRSGKAGAYLLGVLLLLTVYNVQIALHQQVSSGNLPWWSMWAGQIMFALAGLELMRRASQDRLPALLVNSGEMFFLLHQRMYHWVGDRFGKD